MRGGLIVGAGILVGNVTGFFRVIVTAYLLGTHARADGLAVATGPIDTLNQIIINTTLVSFVPMLMLRAEAERAAIFARIGRAFAAILVLIAAATALFAPQIISVIGPGLAPEQHREATLLLRLLSPAVLFGGGSAIFAALLYTERRFVAPALYQACLNGGMIVAALSLWKAAGVNAFAIGYVAGAALQLIATWTLSRDLRARESSKTAVELREIFAKPALYLVYASMIAANVIATRAFATHAGPGMAAAFDYCLRCVSVVVAYLVYPVANSLLPEIGRLRALNRTQEAYRLLDKSIGIMAAASVAASVIGILLRKPAIAILFQHGSFTSDSTVLVARVFLGFAPAIAAWAVLDLMSRCFFALDRPRMPVVASMIPITVNATVMLLIGQIRDPAFLCLGAALGLAVACTAFFTSAHLNRKALQAPEAIHAA
ncbi:MAG: hypothetical protein KGN84_11625 [Acidobacteriota bacterium]|nr:hypothetical protein [Acidobacteriota bacterium]